MTEEFDTLWRRAQPFLPWNLAQRTRNLRVTPTWFADGSAFWYARETAVGPEHVIVEAETGNAALAFDRDAMRAALAALDTDPDAALARLEILDREGGMALDGAAYAFDGVRLRLMRASQGEPLDLLSPDGRHALFLRDGDLWLRAVASGAKTRLTDTGAPHFEWAKSPDQSLETIRLRRQGIALPPVALWSPDSRKILTHQLDERRVKSLPLVQNLPDGGGLRPVLHDLRVAFTGDAELPMAHLAVIDIASGQVTPHAGGPVHVSETSPLEKAEGWWSAAGDKVWFLDHDRYETRVSLIEMDTTTGASREVIRETETAFVDVNMEFGRRPNIRILDGSGEAIWFSQRDGWAHLYLIDLADGAVKRQLTQGEWVVRDILAVDPEARRVVFLAGGMGPCDTPYQRKVCAVSLDGGEVEILTPERGDHDAVMRDLGWADARAVADRAGPLPAAVAPGGRHFVVTRAPIDGLPVSELRRADGTLVARVECGSCAQDDVILPEPFETRAADGETMLHGMIWMPEGAREVRSIPILEMIYPGPQCIEQPLSAWPADPSEFFKTALAGAFARIGIAVVILDARGTPFRSKAFHDLCHRRLHDPGYLEDHASAIAELCDRHPALDPGRVAIMGHSAGGHAAARAILAHGDVWQTAIATAGSHDPRLYNHAWPEKWNGPLIRDDAGGDSYAAADNSRLAAGLRGALMLGHGDLDDNVHPAQTQRLACALIEAGHDFDLLMTPNDDHYSFPRAPYVVRREMAFLVRHLSKSGPAI
ncbi:S9 family peptidase [Limimaricola litoreus]|uniref:S9 family peptidase n=1 Tax=Limimaricola litoreus TaxID=2955316 RepID=A0A9X2JQN7_9RHOB|nr:DPP IV N-terminal domain-containing protein [Limimaricola litoreus]MCP1169515.1 S9 family peptidase [Limimaricola litoreus]